MQGIIIENKSNIYHVKENKTNKIFTCYARGKFKKDQISPVVGDIVEFSITDEREDEAVIDLINERKVYIRRPKLSNLTQLVFVISSKNPKPDLLMIDKQLAFSEFLKLNSIIVLNKVDLDKKNEFKDIKKIYENVGYTVVETEATKGIGIESLKEKMQGNINAFAGNSGVRKIYINKCDFR